MGQAPDISCVVTVVRVTLSSCWVTQRRDCLVVGHVDGADQVQDQLGRVVHPQRVLAEGAEGDDEAALRVLDLVEAAAEPVVRELARADEEDLGPERVAAGGPVHEHAEERQFLGVQRVLAGRQDAHDLALAGEDRHGVRLDDRPGELADVLVRPLKDDLALRAVGRCDELAASLVQKSHRCTPLLPGM